MIIDKPTLQQIPALRALWKQAFGDTDAFLDSFFTLAFSPDRSRCVTEKGALAAALYWFDCCWGNKRLAYIYAVATEGSFRGRGVCRALMEDTHAHLKALGCDGCILVPGSPGLFEMYEKMGYKTCSCIQEFTCAARKPISLRQLTATEYASLRRQYLPAGGVVQEQEALALLQTQSCFYTGENCLFICSSEDGKLTVHELLGDKSAAESIVAALGCTEGKFRTPGTEKPFAMYHGLTKDPAMPLYFGLALD